MTTWDRLNSPVVIGALFVLVAVIGFWMGHVVTFRTAYYIAHLPRGEEDE